MIYYNEFRRPGDYIDLQEIKSESIYDSFLYMVPDTEVVFEYLKNNFDNVNTYVIGEDMVSDVFQCGMCMYRYYNPMDPYSAVYKDISSVANRCPNISLTRSKPISIRELALGEI